MKYKILSEIIKLEINENFRQIYSREINFVKMPTYDVT